MTPRGAVRPLDGLAPRGPALAPGTPAASVDLDEPRRALDERLARWRAERARFEGRMARRAAEPADAADAPDPPG